MKGLVLPSALIFLIGAGPVWAADNSEVPVKAALSKKAAPVSNVTWTGCYLGGQVGGNWGRKEIAGVKSIEDISLPPLTADVGGFTPGGQLGCNYQFAKHGVVGIEGDLAISSINGESTIPLRAGEDATLSAKTQWLASVIGRLGYAWDVWLLYVDGGIAWARDRYDVSGTVADENFDFTGSETRTGWTAGLGLGFSFWGNWSAELTYNFYDFGTTLPDVSSGSIHAVGANQTIEAVKFALNYHFPGNSQNARIESDTDASKSVETVAIDAAASGTRPLLYGNFGILFAPAAGLEQSGFRTRLELVGGEYNYSQDNQRIFGLTEEASLLVGYSLNKNDNSLLLTVGADVEHAKDLNAASATAMSGSTAPVPPGTHAGVKFEVELDAYPTEQTMAYAEVEYSTAIRSYYMDLKLGYAALGPEIYLGPKLVFLGDESFDQYRLGAFVSGFKIGKVELEFSGGYVKDRVQGSGFFAGMDFYVRY